jgi:hypothetical protein
MGQIVAISIADWRRSPPPLVFADFAFRDSLRPRLTVDRGWALAGEALSLSGVPRPGKIHASATSGAV